MTPSNRRVSDSVPPPASAPDEAPVAPQATPPVSPSRWMLALRTTAGVALVLVSSVGVAWAARRHVLTSARFAITDIEVTGNDRRPADALVSESGLAVGTNVFAADLEAARERLLGDSWIAEATLARRLPGTVFIHVAERKPAALVALGDVWLATSDGVPFKRLDPDDPTEVPLVTGVTADMLADDRDGSLRRIRAAIDLAAEYDHGGLARKMPLEEVHAETDGGFTLVVGRSGTELILGAAPFRRKLDQAARVVAELEGRGAKADAIMLDNDARPERVVVRMR
jgi:cell division protein FtsQ